MNRILFLIVCLIACSNSSFAQDKKEVLRLTPQEVETIFIKQNLQLIADKMNIDMADAMIAQAKLWDNPELSISDINLWSNGDQREELDAASFPKNRQFSIELSQMIQTANKKGKQVRMEKISKEITIQEFEETLQGLKLELRKSINELLYIQQYSKIIQNQNTKTSNLVESYRKQVDLGNFPKSELLRLQSSELELENEANEVKTEFNEQQKNIKALLNVNPMMVIEIVGENNLPANPNNILLPKLIDISKENRPEVKQNKLQTQYMVQNLSYERAQRVPDITLSANYDRRGGVWKDFFGFGVSFNLPFLDRNQGNIKVAQIGHKQSEYLLQQQENLVQHEVVEAYDNYAQAYKFYSKISQNSLINELDNMLDIYTKNLMNKNISMLEYIDFMDAYKTNKQTVLSSTKNLYNTFEELQYTIGTELK